MCVCVCVWGRGVSHLQHLGLEHNGTVLVLREILKRQLKSIAESVEHVQVNYSSAICAVGKIFCSVLTMAPETFCK